MHEAGIAARAIAGAAQAAAAAGETGNPRGLEVTFDPGRVTPDSLRFHVELVLRDSGLADLPVTLEPRIVRCEGCGELVGPEAFLLCDACGATLPPPVDPVAEARFLY